MFDPMKRIVCVNLGTRYVGLAAFQGGDLRDWRVRSFNGKWSKAKERKIVDFLKEYLDRWQPKLVVCKEIDPCRSSPELDGLAASLMALLKARGIRAKSYPVRSLVEGLAGRKRKSKKILGEAVARRFPALIANLEKERRSLNPYYQRMFEAVALGSVCLGGLENI